MKFVRLALAITVSLVLLCCLCPAVQADDDKVEVELKVEIVPPPPPGGGGGGGGIAVGPMPVISNVAASNITEISADISWETDQYSSSQVEYGASPSMFSKLDIRLVREHHVHLTGLTPATTYHYRVMSKGYATGLAVSDEYSFTTLGEAPAAAFASSDLSISPGEVNIGETVTISVMVTNTGDAAGSYKVTLKINGVVEATKEVTLDAGASQEVTFTTLKDKAATYSVAVDGLSGSFTVKEEVAPAPPPPPAPAPPVPKAISWWLIGGIIAGVIAVGLLIFFLIRKRAA